MLEWLSTQPSLGLDLDRAVVEQFGVAVVRDFVHLVTSGPCEVNIEGL